MTTKTKPNSRPNSKVRGHKRKLNPLVSGPKRKPQTKTYIKIDRGIK